MRSSWSEPYLWVHLAGVAAVPIFLELCLLGLAASQSLPNALVFLLVAATGIAPIVWMQWQRPFCIFSLIALALKPNQLTETQRQILRLFKAPIEKVITVAIAIAALAILWQLNQAIPLALPKAFLVPGGSLGGLVLAAVAFLFSNLFLQVPASTLSVLLTPETQLQLAEPYPVTQIGKDFTLIGLPVKQILPPVVSLPASSTAAQAPVNQPKSAEAQSQNAGRSVQPLTQTSEEPSEPISDSTEATEASAAVFNNVLNPELVDADFVSAPDSSTSVSANLTDAEPATPEPPADFADPDSIAPNVTDIDSTNSSSIPSEPILEPELAIEVEPVNQSDEFDNEFDDELDDELNADLTEPESNPDLTEPPSHN